MLDNWISQLFDCKILAEDDVLSLISKAKEMFLKEPNVLALNSPITICGDIHGQFEDLLELFKVSGLPPLTRFLFLGDYVDRGHHSIEVFSLLLCLKLKWPNHVYLLRGNHESRQITQVYGFYDECTRKYSKPSIWRAFTDLFDFLPLAAVVNDEIFCCHGGLSPAFEKIDFLKEIDRQKEVPSTGPVCDLLWSDPDVLNGWNVSQRGAGFTFGPDITKKFHETNNTKMICRAHQLMMGGYMYHHDEACVTVFSAPNYCYRCGNLATVMEVSENGQKDFLTYDHAPELKDLGSNPDFFL